MKVKGTKYSAKDEIRDKKMNIKESKSMDTAGISNELMQAKMNPSSCNILRVKPQKKNAKLTTGKSKY